MAEDLTGQQALQIVKQSMTTFTAAIQAAQLGARQKIQQLTIDLSIGRDKGNALKISFPFASLYVEQASDTNCFVKAIPESVDDGMGEIQLSLKDTFTDEFGFRSLYLYWPVQPNKKMVIKFFTTSKFQTGSLIQAAQSQLPMLKVGHGQAPDDGFSVVCSTMFLTGAASTTQARGLEFFGDTSANGTHPQVSGPGYKIPAGFQGRIIGVEMDNPLATAFAGSCLLKLGGANPNTNYVDAVGLYSSVDMGYYFNNIARSLSNVFFNRAMGVLQNFGGNVIIPSGSVCCFATSHNGTWAGSGNIDGVIKVLIRIEKLVG